ncbi:MAG: hypothetical protein JSV81_10295 [Anaerolineales bacterium]|nr:MAG: hypothetical protein JSV81_10295 [Anaerolineales bacterium]
MPNTLLSTKLNIPPRRPNLVVRPHLTERLNAALTCKLTLVSAPAGYGKTTLVSEWVHQSGRGGVTKAFPIAWLSLDASDNDPSRFFSYLIAALQAIHPDIGAEIEPILEADSDPLAEFEPWLVALVNDIAATGQSFVLALDDYHVISELQIHLALDFLLDHIPPGMHIVIISRADPPMPLGRLRVQRELVEFREADLRFGVDETAAFLNDLMGLALSPEDIRSLEARTEGWIAGLQLAALTLHDRPDQHNQVVSITGSHRHLIDYLVHEVMSRQPEPVRAFLHQTSVLERFNASLCDAVMLASDSRDMLSALEKANLFLVPLDEEHQWYRYHHLFADFLRQRLHATLPGIATELHVRASAWYEAQGMLDKAFQHALVGEDARRAARLLDENIETLILSRAAVNQVIGWADKLPVHVRREFPRLCIYHAWALQFEYQLEAAEAALALAEAHLAEPGGWLGSFPASQVTSHAAVIRAYMAAHRGEFQQAVDLYHAALGAMPEDDTHGMQVVRAVIALGQGIANYELGQMETAHQTLESALTLNQQAGSRYPALACLQYLMLVDLARGALNQAYASGEKGLFWIKEWSRLEGRKRRPARMAAHLRWQMAKVQYERNDLDHATRNLNMATEYYELVGSWSRVQGYLLLVDLHQALGNVVAALNYLRKVKRLSLTPGFSLPNVPWAAQVAERSLLLSRSRPDLNHLSAEAGQWAETSGLSPRDEFRYQQEYQYLVLARVLVAQGNLEAATPLLERLITSAEGAARWGQLITYLSLQAVAYHTQGKTDTALSYLSRALALGEPEGYLRTFVDLGPPMRDLLHIRAGQGMAPRAAYLSRLLAAFPDVEADFIPSPLAAAAQVDIEGLLEPLSERELQILRRLAARRSYQEIADELYLSLNTIKWYAKNIYGKLGVRGRDQAASRARELGLL